MAIRGRNFLHASRANRFDIAEHALDRLGQYTGFESTRGLASILFANSRQISIDEMRLMGYNPAYERRKQLGIPTWYFRFVVFGQELVAVITGNQTTGSFAWVTTYGHVLENYDAFGCRTAV